MTVTECMMRYACRCGRGLEGSQGRPQQAGRVLLHAAQRIGSLEGSSVCSCRWRRDALVDQHGEKEKGTLEHPALLRTLRILLDISKKQSVGVSECSPSISALTLSVAYMQHNG